MKSVTEKAQRRVMKAFRTLTSSEQIEMVNKLKEVLEDRFVKEVTKHEGSTVPDKEDMETVS